MSNNSQEQDDIDGGYSDGDAPIIAAETMARDMLQAMITELRNMPDCWQKLTMAKQDDVIERLRKRIKYNVEKAVTIIAGDSKITVHGDLAQVTLKDGIKAVFEIGKNHPHRHQLMDCIGKTCLIVVADAEDYTGDLDGVRGDADQQSFFDERGKREPKPKKPAAEPQPKPEFTGIGYLGDVEDGVVSDEDKDWQDIAPINPDGSTTDDGDVDGDSPVDDGTVVDEASELRDTLEQLDDDQLDEVIDAGLEAMSNGDDAPQVDDTSALDEGLPPAEKPGKANKPKRGKKDQE